MNIRYILRRLPLFAAPLALTACTSDAGRIDRLTVYLCDSPADYKSVVFVVEGVEIRNASDGTWLTLSSVPVTVPLLSFVNGTMLAVGTEIVPQGSYDRVRLTLRSENASVTVGAQSYPMAIPDPVLEVPVAVTMNGEIQSVLIDIDAAASVADNGDNNYSFEPVAFWCDLETMGAVQGGVVDNKGNALNAPCWISFASAADQSVRSTYALGSSPFFMRLAPGDYTMTITPPAASQIASYTRELTVESRKVVDFGMISLP